MENWTQLKILFENEEWRPVVGYEGLYEVSNLGRVRSLNYKKKKGNIQILTPSLNKQGYLKLHLVKEKKVTTRPIHRLVAETFIPNDDPEHKTQCNHKDECKTRNFVWVNEDGSIDPEKSNLEWMTPKDNTNWGTCIERRIRSFKDNGKLSKPVAQIAPDGTIVKIWPSTKEAGRNGFQQSNIWFCCLGKYGHKTHRGFRWEYV